VAGNLAEVLRRFAANYQQRYPKALLPSHQRAIRDILACHTPAAGGHLWHCPHCQQQVYIYHGCHNRSCPSCHAAQTQQWLQQRQAELLPCPYFHLTATVPEGLRKLFRSHQKRLYDLLMTLTARTIKDIAANPRYLGAMPGILAVLHTWTAQLTYHPHVHCLVTAGGVSPDHKLWVPTRPGFFLPVRVLSRHLRHLFQKTLLRSAPSLAARVPAEVWKQEWVVHCVPWGQQQHGVLEYLARYVFRCAITDGRILSIHDHAVRFHYKDRKAQRLRVCQLTGIEFVRRFLQHVLPQGFHKVRYYGLWHPRQQALAARVRQLLTLQQTPPPQTPPAPSADAPAATPFSPACPYCGCHALQHVAQLPRPRSRSP
jgi:hypothetical protein